LSIFRVLYGRRESRTPTCRLPSSSIRSHCKDCQSSVYPWDRDSSKRKTTGVCCDASSMGWSWRDYLVVMFTIYVRGSLRSQQNLHLPRIPIRTWNQEPVFEADGEEEMKIEQL
jgi:hypothetical protein